MNRPLLAISTVSCGVLAAGLLGGCNGDSFLDPSQIGRWEHTPARVPILTRLAVIEDPEFVVVEPTPIQPADLIPESDPYIVGPGDFVQITIYGLQDANTPQTFERAVDQGGQIEIPQLGLVRVSGLTEQQVVQRIKDEASEFIRDPDVSLVVTSRRQQTFHIFGGVPNPGPYVIPSSDYKILQALIASGWSFGNASEIHVIRQVPLTAETMGDVRNGADANNNDNDPSGDSGEDLLDVIDDLSQPAPGVFGSIAAQPDQPDPVIDLITNEQATQPQVQPAETPTASSTRWVFRDGQWVRAQAADRVRIAAPDQMPDPLAAANGMVTQRVIRIPTKPLVDGDARYNIIVRPGDTIRVPLAQTGVIYLGGQIARPGSFNLPPSGNLTLYRAINSAGGLGGLAIPERVDLTRIVGKNEQATVMVNLRAIAEGTQPDIYLKPDDHIVIGTNFWATPLAIVRNGFRASYGFGFLLDRNFGNDVFGAPPTNVSR